jgi:manganese transport protein
MFLQHKGFRWLEALVLALILVISICFLLELVFSRPCWSEVAGGLLPTPQIVTNPQMLYLAIGILGATVMPHNLYLHSSIVQTRKYEQTASGKAEAVKYATFDAVVALTSALLINGSILIVSAAVFHRTGQHQVAEIQEAYKLLSPTMGVAVASTLFALALLASGQSSTLTGTLAGQIVMEGFLNLRLRPWVRRMMTRALAIGPALLCAVLYGGSGIARLLVLSQAILSLQLSFAVIPLVIFTSDREKMGEFVNPPWVKALAWTAAALVVGLNAKFLLDFVGLTG